MMHAVHTVGTLGSKIINGKKVPANSMLYMASVQDSSGRHICGGFLINEDFVVTAAHCELSVVLGTHNLKKINNGTMRYAVEKFKNPFYDGVQSGNDIMLLKLSKKTQLGRRVKPIKLPKAGVKLSSKENCHVAGWGLTKTGGNTVNVLQVVKVPVVSLNVCKEEWNQVKINLPDTVICAGGYGTKGGFCQGDSGGPLVCRGMAVGVVLFNLALNSTTGNCDYPNKPNVYTNVMKYLDWIKEIIKKQKRQM
uniref:Peptidase S1 domain-containing protein n=1 Tax=Mola mola TaxID=94237 RepID=A0A3Q3VXA8_MOLML